MLWDKQLYTNIGLIQGTLNTNTPTSDRQLSALVRAGQDFWIKLGIRKIN